MTAEQAYRVVPGDEVVLGRFVTRVSSVKYEGLFAPLFVLEGLDEQLISYRVVDAMEATAEGLKRIDPSDRAVLAHV